MLKALRKKSKGFTLIELLIVVAIIGILAAIAIPNLLAAQTKGKIVRAAGDSKTGVTQCIVYANDKNANCGSMAILRNSGYANIRDQDPWSRDWVYSPAFANTATPAVAGEIGACSKGAAGTGTCAFPLTDVPAEVVNGSVGYSSIYGSWQSKV